MVLNCKLERRRENKKMIKKELLNALKNLDAETIINFVDNEMKEVYKKLIVILYLDGHIVLY